MYIVDSNAQTIAICTNEDHARVVAAQEKRDHPNNTVIYLKCKFDKDLNEIVYNYKGEA